MSNQTMIILLAIGAAVWWLDRRLQERQAATNGNVNDLLYQVPGSGYLSHGPVLV